MKNFLSKLWSLSRTDRVRTLSIDAMSLPSFCRVNMLKLVSVLVILLTIGSGNVWGANKTYAKITSTDDVVSGGKYLIVCEDEPRVFKASSASNGAATESESVTITSSTITCDETYAFTITGSTGSWKITGTNGSIGHLSGKNTLGVNNIVTNAITFDNSGNANIYCDSRYLRCNSNNGSPLFRYYTSGQQAVQLYKESSSCDKKVTLSTGSLTNGTISFSPAGPVATCDGSVNVTMTITPNTGYYLSAYSKSGVNTSNSPSISTSGSSSEAAQTPTLTFAQNTNGTYTANATFSAIAVTGVSLNKSSTTIVEGNTETLTATVTPSNARDKAVTWSSGTPGVATVNSSGVVTAVSAGNATITVTTHDGSFTANCTVTVTAAARDHFIDAMHSTTGYTGDGMEKVGNYSASIPSIADKAKNTTGTCQEKHYHFTGWVTAANRANPEGNLVTLDGNASNTTYYAVWEEEAAGGASGTESVSWSSRYDATTVVEGVALSIGTNVTVTHNKGSNATTCKYYTTGPGIRVYGGGNFVVEAPSAITAITLTFGTEEGSNAITSDVGTYSNGSWTGSAATVTFSVGGTTGHRRIASISVTYGGGTSYENPKTSCSADPVDPTVTFNNGEYTVGGDALDLRDLWTSNSSGAVTYTVTNANGTGATIAGDGYSFSATTAGSCTVQASQAAVPGVYNAISRTATITVNPPTCATPTFNNGTGTYNNDVSVTISCATASSTIHYTTGASPADPTCSSGSTGTSVTINATGTTLKAVACKDGYNVSAVASATYTLKCATPTISVAAGTYSSAQSVTLACTTDGATIKYTTDGRDPATYGTTYSSAITISDDATLKVVATKTNYDNSDLASATYKIMDCDWYESFDTNDGTDGCSGTNAGASFKSDHDGWSATYKYGGAGYARFGKSSTASAATTPTITGLTGDLTLKFRARAWDSEGGSMSLSVSDGTLSSSSVTITSCEWDDYNVTISGVTEDFTITFKGPTRYFLDEVCVKGPSSFTVTFDANGHGTAPDPITDVAKNSTISKPTPDPSATGWTFGGWYKEPACTNAWTWATDQVTSNTTLYAKWTCVAPTTATVSATGSKWDYCAGESMTLTAGGTGIGDGATYIWKVSHDGGSSYSNAPGTNNASTYSVASMTLAHGGKYTCTISNGSCSTTSSAYDVKVWCVHINNGAAGAYQDIAFTNTGTGTGTANVALDADQSYGFKLWNNNGASIGWYGLDSKTITTTESNITLNSSGANVGINAGLGGTYVFTIDYTSATSPKVSVTYPVGNQPSGRKIWFDKSVITGWTDAGTSDLVWRIGKKANSMTNQDATANYFTLVPGTDRFYEYTTKEYNGFEAWHVANNVAWSGNSDNNPDYDNHSIYTHYHNQNSTDVKYATVYQKYVIGTSGVTLVPTTKKNTDWYCDFWNVTKYDGMLTHTATITPPTNGTITIANAAQSLEETTTTADLPHRTILTVTATPAPGYQLSSLTVNGVAFTSGNEYILSADATIAATFGPKTINITWEGNGGTPSKASDTWVYNTSALASLPTATKDGKVFVGWFTDPSSGSQIDNVGGSNKPTDDVTYYAHWSDGNTVQFHAGVGSVTPTSLTQTTLGGAVAAFPTPTIDCEGWSFAGWKEGSAQAETTTNPEASLYAGGTNTYVPATATVHMYAVWKKNFGGGTGTVTNTFDWEAANSAWSKSSMSNPQSYSDYKHGGSYSGNVTAGGAYIYYLTKLESPLLIDFYYTKTSNNDNSGNYWCVQTSTNGSSWTTRETSLGNNSLGKGTYEHETVDLSSYSNIYVKLLWSNGSSSAGGNLDDVTISYTGTIADAWKWTSSADDYGCVSANQVKTPVISPDEEAQTGDVSVTITCATDGATIRYTTDGTDPSSSTGTVYSSAFTVSCSATVKAIAYKTTMDDSEIAEQEYTVTVPTPTFSLPAGTYYDANQSVTLSLPTAHTGTVIKYTTNGDDPTSSSATYSSAITVTEGTTTIKAIGYNSTCGTSSEIASATYIVRFGTDYTLVTDANDLMAGDQVVIISADAGTSSKYAISTTISSNKRTSTSDYNINAGLTTAKIYPAVGAAATVQIFTLGGEPGAWTFHETTNNGYLNCPSAGKLTNTATVSNSNKWTIAIESNIATIHNNDVDATIKSNTAAGHVFAAYGPATENVQLVKLYSIPNPNPVIKIEADLSTFAACRGSASEYQSFIVSGKNLDGDIVISGPTGYEFCLTSGGTYTATLNISPVTKTVAKTQVFVRLAAGATAGTKNGNLNAAVSANSLSTNIAVTGSVSTADTYTDQIHNTVVVNQCGEYLAPSCPDASAPADESCVETHFKFMGWITEADKNASGVKDDAWYLEHLITAGTAMTADGTNYYAVWAKEED